MAWLETEDGSVFETANPEHHKGCKRIAKAEGLRRDKEHARELLRGMFPPGSTAYTVLRHVSSSGMSRRIAVLFVEGSRPRDVSHLVARALSYKLHERGGVVVGGCGMDMGFSLVYNLSHALHGAGYECLGKRENGRTLCPSSYHSNHRDSVRCEGVERNGEQLRCYQPGGFGRHEVPADWPRVTVREGTGDPALWAERYALQDDPETDTANADGYSPTKIARLQELNAILADEQREIVNLAACLFASKDAPTEDGTTREVCPTCKGLGRLPNPEGPERFDLVHADGYAIRHEWV